MKYNYFNDPQSPVRAYDFRDEKWQKLPQPISDRYSGACSSYKGHVYVSGGCIETCEMYDPVAAKWKEIAPLIKSVHDHQMVSYKNSLWVVGGWRQGCRSCDVDKYDPMLNEWSSFSILQNDRFYRILDAVVFKPYL